MPARVLSDVKAVGVPPSTPRWLQFVMLCDKHGSSWFIALGFFFAPLLLILEPWPVAVAIAWGLISVAALWLGILGVFMAAGLARVLRAGEEIPEQFWWGIIGPSR